MSTAGAVLTDRNESSRTMADTAHHAPVGPTPGRLAATRKADMQQQRPSFAPAKKTAPPYLMISLLGVLLLVAIIFTVKVIDSQAPVDDGGGEVDVVDNDSEYTAIKRAKNKAHGLYRDAMNLKVSEDFDKFTAKAKEAKQALGDILERMDDMLDEVRDQETGRLPPEYSGYTPIYSDCQTWLSDLNKVTGFGL